MISKSHASLIAMAKFQSIFIIWHFFTVQAFMHSGPSSSSSTISTLCLRIRQDFGTSLSPPTITTSSLPLSSFFADATDSKKTSTDTTVSKQASTNIDADTTLSAQQPTVISSGDIVAISSSCPYAIKAHSVPKACYGSFHPTSRKFVPAVGDDGKIPRSESCLVLPIGLRGRVMQVYDAEILDRARPYLVKFEEGMDREETMGDHIDGRGVNGEEEERGEGFVVPKGFAMHFSAEEIELVSSFY